MHYLILLFPGCFERSAYNITDLLYLLKKNFLRRVAQKKGSPRLISFFFPREHRLLLLLSFFMFMIQKERNRKYACFVFFIYPD